MEGLQEPPFYFGWTGGCHGPLGCFIFDQARARVDRSPAKHDEPPFDFYDRYANDVIGLVRENLGAWFSRCPFGRHRRDLLGRLRDGDRRQWGSAAWELYVHEAIAPSGST